MENRDKISIILKEVGQKATKNRLDILEFLIESHSPKSVADVSKKFKSIDTVTIYRTLETLLKARIVSKIDLGQGHAYFEYSAKHHHHAICEDCGLIEEIPDCVIPNNFALKKKIKNFAEISRHSMEFFGLCRTCHNNK